MERENRLVAGASIALLAIVAAAFAFYRFRSSAARPQPAPVVSAPVVAPVKPPEPSELSLPGAVQAAQTVNVPVPIDGNIEELLADPGEDVSRGQVLARIKSPKLEEAVATGQLEVERARAQIASLESSILSSRLEVSRAEADATRARRELERAEKEYERQKMMMNEGVTPRLVFERAQQEYNRLKAEAQNQADFAKGAAERVSSMSKELDEAHRTLDKRTTQLQEAQLERTAGEVSSPADGVVVAKHAEAGQAVTRAMKDLFQIAADLTRLQVVVSPDSESLKRIRPGQAAVIEIPEAQATVPAKVGEIRADQVTVEFASPSPIVRPGMAARVRIK